MLLDDKERQKFIAWLEITAETCKGMAEQMEKLPSPAMTELVKKEKIKAGACLLIANDLRSAESLTIGEA